MNGVNGPKGLESIKQEVQEVAEAISLAVGCDVEAISDNLTRVAATGSIRTSLGQPLQHGHIYKHTMQTQKTIVVSFPGTHFLCETCKNK